MVEKHRHCLNCGISIPPDQVFCSEKCRMEYLNRRKKMMRVQYMFIGIAILLIIYVFISNYFIG
ncbi:Protein of unknown function DUF2116, Zn-ribbon [Methanocaldococcus infernus ME]|uniref:DUF2116 family Zn-ribbon domain-containing protein n=1 Tax=Methanocaldococcus infernus (strain DSM 11812 / JCM 15783 / ME) TaxID=573063 RepID=D5VT91_METIM|nr:DUF2116 family Zn-ribbon domain-containing protein [Methanocaldococcus infernus]ADG13794.1 Protein of unknown function DUF2116, Zn-ribbon [Methanocaldococcus infernus ME]